MVITNKAQDYNLFPETTEESVAQNIRLILSTYKGTVPLNRNLGIDTTFIDMPSNKGLLISKLRIVEAIQKDEPRVEVSSISIEKDEESALNGDFKIKVEVNILDEFK